MTVATRENYREAIGTFATGVTVVTTAHNGQLKAMTANSVTSVSLEPILLLVCVDRTTHTHPILHEAGHFVVNILAKDQEDISRMFASKDSHLSPDLMGQPHRIGRLGSPILENTIAYLECRTRWVVPGGDHDIFMGEVEELEVVRPEAEPLLFYRGRYADIALRDAAPR